MNVYRNGVSLGTAATNTAGRFFVSIIPANNGNTSAVYSAENGIEPTPTPGGPTPTATPPTLGRMSATSVEERSDAGTPPVGDQNAARAFVDRASLDSALGGTFALIGEGFQAGETVTISVCAAGGSVADANGSFASFLNATPGPGNIACVLTGGTSGRIARASVLAHPNVVNLRGLIAGPSSVHLEARSTSMRPNYRQVTLARYFLMAPCKRAPPRPTQLVVERSL